MGVGPHVPGQGRRSVFIHKARVLSTYIVDLSTKVRGGWRKLAAVACQLEARVCRMFMTSRLSPGSESSSLETRAHP